MWGGIFFWPGIFLFLPSPTCGEGVEAVNPMIIFGAKVNPDGTPSAALRERLDIGIRLYHQGYVDHLVMTGIPCTV